MGARIRVEQEMEGKGEEGSERLSHLREGTRVWWQGLLTAAR